MHSLWPTAHTTPTETVEIQALDVSYTVSGYFGILPSSVTGLYWWKTHWESCEESE